MRHVAVLGAPSSIGLRPHHDSGTPQHVNRAPGTLRGLRVVERLDATDYDADVLNPEVMPAVGSPEPGGPDIDELGALLAPLIDHAKALGIALALYDPSLDPDLSSAARLVELLTQSVLGGKRHATPA